VVVVDHQHRFLVSVVEIQIPQDFEKEVKAFEYVENTINLESHIRAGGDQLQPRSAFETGWTEIIDLGVGEVDFAVEYDVVPEDDVGFEVGGVYTICG
jgi:hypothetical protein